MKKNNPNTPIMLREAAGTQPRVYARYGKFSFAPDPVLGSTVENARCTDIIAEFGQEKSESLAGLSDKEIEDKVTGLVKTGL
jgi:NADH dehydrogenase (ubiquinone) 1 alpha subcomplex subunit 2